MTTLFKSIQLGLILGVLSGLLACKTSSSSSSGDNESSPHQPQVTIKNSSSDIAPDYKNNSELMFHVMTAEIAGHRQDMKSALKYYLKAIQLSNNPQLAERATRIALYAKDQKAALKASLRWSQLKPDNAEPHRFIAILYLRNGDKENSLKELKKYYGMLTGPQRDRFASVIRLYSQESKRNEAFEVVKRFVEAHSDNAGALYSFARFAFKIRRYDDALKSIDKAIQLKPDAHNAKLLRARILMSSGQKDRALREMDVVLKKNPRDRVIRINYARLLTEAKMYDQARKQFEFLLRANPKDGDILYALALLSLQSKNYKAASAYLKRMIKTGGRRENEAYFQLGLIAENRRRYDAAIAWLSKVRQGDRQIDAHLRIASIMSKKGDVEAARRFLYQLRPRTKRLAVRLYLAEADILHRANRTQDAMDVINNALNNNPDHHDLLYARAMMAEKLNQLDLVEKDLKKIIAANPKNAQALNALGYTLADRTKRYKEAYGYIKKALALAPNQAAIIDSMGWVQYRLGNYEESVKHLRRALSLDKNAEIAAHLGEVLWTMGKKQEAKRAWAVGLQVDSSNATLKETLKRFNQ